MTTDEKISIALPPEMVAIVRSAVAPGNVSSVAWVGFQPTSVI
jgi:Arc/MetJ-type ribon-helix-helix transcriptional regulator